MKTKKDMTVIIYSAFLRYLLMKIGQITLNVKQASIDELSITLTDHWLLFKDKTINFIIKPMLTEIIPNLYFSRPNNKSQ